MANIYIPQRCMTALDDAVLGLRTGWRGRRGSVTELLERALAGDPAAQKALCRHWPASIDSDRVFVHVHDDVAAALRGVAEGALTRHGARGVRSALDGIAELVRRAKPARRRKASAS
jgi:hypothetical protein